MQRVAIIGRGYVGRALEDFFKGKYEIVIYDPPQGFVDKRAVNTADLAVVSVPTKMNEDGTADLSAVEDLFLD
jgi:UDP-N-acetyl-D-mannosaminuronate dehydrogenase